MIRNASIIGLVLGMLCACAAPQAVGVADPESALPALGNIDAQPIHVYVERLHEALRSLGQPLSESEEARLAEARKTSDADQAMRMIQQVLDPHCLVGVTINPESRVKVDSGPAQLRLLQQGWTGFLVKVHNQAGVTAPLRVLSHQILSMHNAPTDQLEDRWLDAQWVDQRPLAKTLSGIELEYRILMLYSRDAGQRAAVLSFDVGQGTQELGFRNDIAITFSAQAAMPVTLGVKDEQGQPVTAAFEVRDARGRTYPAQTKRRAPDFSFHPQVYRADGETLLLPPGVYDVQCRRGPEYHAMHRRITVTDAPIRVEFKLNRWVNPAARGWWSGDHHIHAAGCAHFAQPTEGVTPDVMMRHCLGEDLKIGATLTWGPGFDYQKQFFTGRADQVSKPPYLLRYDVEVSGFGSHRSGHLCLLQLKEQIYPGGDSKNHWPTLGLNTLRWAKKQGALCGPAHSGWGLGVRTTELPNDVVPPYDSIGANEYIVDVTHKVPGPDGKLVPAVDFMSTVDTPYVWELNMWYHTLNCGFRTRISGETDFPCIYGERVGLGRSYVKVDGDLTYEKWCEGIRNGNAYVSDGLSHLMDFSLGKQKLSSGDGELRLDQPGFLRASVRVAALLPETPDKTIRPYKQVIGEVSGQSSRWAQGLRPFWHLERARLGNTRNVNVELLVNGLPVAKKTILADGLTREVYFDVEIAQSSWVAYRILGSSHTNPIFVTVAGKPIRASLRSAQWCLDGVEQCWSQKKGTYAESEMADAVAAYEHARTTYRKILSESIAE